MKSLKRIIVGVDIVEKSDNVIKRALMLAEENDAQLFIVHVVHIPWLSVPDYFGSGDITVDTKSIAKKIEKKIKTLNGTNKVLCSVLVKEGDADDVLLYESKLLKADMIIIGAHSKKKGKKSYLGTTTQKVVQQSHVPVLIVKNSVKEAYKKIIAPTDFQAQSKQSILCAKDIFPTAKLNIVHAFETLYMAEGPYAFDGNYALVDVDFLEYNKLTKSRAKNRVERFYERCFC